MRRLFTTAVVAAALMGAACGGGDKGDTAVEDTTTTAAAAGAPTASAAAKHGCDYVTKADVDAIIGATTKGAQDTSTESVGLCSYDADEPLVGVGLRIEHGGAGSFDATNEATGRILKVQPRPEPGIGEKATWYYRTEMGVDQGQLTVVAKGELITVTLSGAIGDEAAAKGKSKALAQKIIDAI